MISDKAVLLVDGDVAWKIAPVADNDQDSEDTTCSIPQDLFVELNASEDKLAVEMPGTPPGGPFGSDRFWEWLTKMSGARSILTTLREMAIRQRPIIHRRLLPDGAGWRSFAHLVIGCGMHRAPGSQ